jgi:hypothetical protein
MERWEEQIIEEAVRMQRLREMAYPRSKIADILSRGMNIRNTHLLKLFYFRSFTQYVDGWANTVYKLAQNTYKDNRTNKWPDKEFLYYHLFGGQEDSFMEHLPGFISGFNNKKDPDYKDLPTITVIEEKKAFNFCKEYYQWVAEELSKNGVITFDDVENKIASLILKYPYDF